MKNTETETLDPIVKTVRVSLSPEAAFDRFTSRMADWWPLEKHSVGQEHSISVEFGRAVGESIIETLDDGSTAKWGTINEWDPPRAVRFTWHPGREETDQVNIRVTFSSIENGSEVKLVHGGWEHFGEKAHDLRAGYDGGWDVVLELYAS